MDASWASVLSKLVALAAVIALSPITIIPAVLVLHAPRPRPASLAFLGGWLVGLVAFTAAFVAGSGSAQRLPCDPAEMGVLGAPGLRGGAPRAGGVPLVHPEPQPQHAPVDAVVFHALPARAGVVGAVLVPLRPEVLILCAAAGLAVGNSSLSAGGELVAAAIFVVAAASTVAIPILAYAGSGDRFEGTLERLKAWMEANHDAMLAVILFLIGLIVLYNGIRALA